jgi:hypothetical protein
MSDEVKSRLTEIAASTGPLLRERPWLHRRVHRVTFTPDGLARNSISIDFTVPDDLPPFMDLDGERDVYFVPLMALRKWPPLMRMDLRDQHGEPFPLLTTPRNELIDGEALAAMAPEGTLRDATVDILRRLPSADEHTAYKEIEALSRIVLSSAEDLDDEVRQQWRATLLTATSLASNFLLWARVDARKSERLIVKVAYEHPIETERRLWRRVFQSLSWAPLRLRVPVRDIGFGMSYHVQVEPPPDLAVHRADLRLYSSPQAEQAESTAEPRGARGISNLLWAVRNTAAVRFERLRTPLQEHKAEMPGVGVPWAWHDDDRAYLYVRDAQSASGVARVELATSRRGLRPAAALMGAGTTAFLLVMTLLSTHVVRHTEATVAVLVLATWYLPLVNTR